MEQCSILRSYHFLSSTTVVPLFSGFVKLLRTCEMFGNMVIFYGQELLAHGPTYQSGGPTLFGCPRLLIPRIRSCPPYLRAVFPTATWGCAMTWWQGPTYHGEIIEPVKITQSETLKSPLNRRICQETNKKFLTVEGNVCLCGVGIVTRLQDTKPRNRGSILLCKSVRSISGPNSRRSLLGDKAAEAWRWSPPSIQCWGEEWVKIHYTYTPPYAFTVCTGVLHFTRLR